MWFLILGAALFLVCWHMPIVAWLVVGLGFGVWAYSAISDWLWRKREVRRLREYIRRHWSEE
jgi:hypothetical protein